MNDNENIEINLDDDNENIDIDREDSIYTNISEEEINEIRSRIEANEDNIVVLQNESGNKVALSINSNYVMTLKLLNKANEVLSTGTIDLPIESMVVNASYRNGVLTLTLQNGQTLDVDISDIINGLVSETTFNSAISRLEGLISGLDTRMTSAEGDIDALENDVSDIKTEQVQQNTDIQTNKTNIATNTQDIANIKAEQTIQNNKIRTNETDISTIKQEQTTQNTKIQKNETDITDIKTEQATQNTNIEKNTTDIATNKASIETIQTEQVEQNENIQENANSIAELEQKHDTEVAQLNEKIADLQEQVEMASDLIPTGDESGSDITVNDSAKYRFKKIVPGGKSEQETFTGKNKFNKNARVLSASHCTYEYNNGIYRITNTDTSNPSLILQLDLPTGTYILNSESFLSASTQIRNENGELIVNFGSDYKSQNFTIQQRASSIRFNWSTTTDIIVLDLNTLMISTEGGDYEKYVGGQPAPSPIYECPIQNITGDVEVKVENKNKYYSPTTGNKTINNVTLNYENNSSEITINGTATATISDSFSIKPISLEAGTYTASIKGLNVISSNADRIFLKNNDTSNIIVNSIKDVTPQTFTLTETTNVVPVFIIASGSSYSNKIIQIQIEEGSTATEYIAHEEQTAIFPLEEGQVLHENDTIEDKIVQRRNTLVLDGTENWTLSNVNVGQFNLLRNDVKQSQGLCNYFKCKTVYSAGEKPYMRIVDNHIYAELGTEFLPEVSVNAWKNWLAEKYANGTPVTIEYELVTPLEIPFTEAQRTAKAQIDKLYSYKGTTHITSNANLDVTYRKDLNSKLEELESRIVLLEE